MIFSFLSSFTEFHLHTDISASYFLYLSLYSELVPFAIQKFDCFATSQYFLRYDLYRVASSKLVLKKGLGGSPLPLSTEKNWGNNEGNHPILPF